MAAEAVASLGSVDEAQRHLAEDCGMDAGRETERRIALEAGERTRRKAAAGELEAQPHPRWTPPDGARPVTPTLLIEVDGKAGSTYRCRITNTSTGDYVYTNEAQVSSIEVLAAEETMMSDKEHSHYHLLFSGGTGPYLVELRRYTSWWVDSDRAVHSQWLITDADPKNADEAAKYITNWQGM